MKRWIVTWALAGPHNQVPCFAGVQAPDADTATGIIREAHKLPADARIQALEVSAGATGHTTVLVKW